MCSARRGRYPCCVYTILRSDEHQPAAIGSLSLSLAGLTEVEAVKAPRAHTRHTTIKGLIAESRARACMRYGTRELSDETSTALAASDAEQRELSLSLFLLYCSAQETLYLPR